MALYNTTLWLSSVNFINVLRTAFALIDPESVEKIDNLTVFFTLLGSAGVKGVRRTLMKSSPDHLPDENVQDSEDAENEESD
jgi:hypothetical protein